MTEEMAIHRNYQKNMDWLYWINAYWQRTGADTIPFYPDNKTSEQIIDEVLSNKPLVTTFDLYGEFRLALFIGALIEPVFNKTLNYDNSTRGKIRKSLKHASILITKLMDKEKKCGRELGDISAFKAGVVGIDYEQPLDAIKEAIEIKWLEKNSFEKEAYLKRTVLLLGKKVNLSGPYISRAVGLWLWDYKKTGKRGMTRAFRQKYRNVDELLKYEDADLRFFYNITDECIRAADVLPIRKLKRGT